MGTELSLRNKLFPEEFSTEPKPKELHLNKNTKEIGFASSMRISLRDMRVFYYRLLAGFNDMIKASEFTKYGAVICVSIKNTKLKLTRVDPSNTITHNI